MGDPGAFPVVLPRDVAIFREPRWLVGATPAWIEHMPFAAWIVSAHRPRCFVELGTHYGNSYFAIVQAIDDERMDCRAFAVDTWQGDEHSGLYGAEVFEAVDGHNRQYYSHFSTLVRSTFDDAVEHFGDGEVDLLHIDGHHTYESVKQDYETWLPKLSEAAVVLFHDIAVRERDFGVHRLWDEVSSAHPAFAFDHGHGLGVAGIGPDQTGPLRALYGLENSRAAACKEVFASIGKGLTLDATFSDRVESVRVEASGRRDLELADMRAEFDGERAQWTGEEAALRAAHDQEIEELCEAHRQELASLEITLQLAERRAAAEFDSRLSGRGAS